MTKLFSSIRERLAAATGGNTIGIYRYDDAPTDISTLLKAVDLMWEYIDDEICVCKLGKVCLKHRLLDEIKKLSGDEK